MKASIFIPTKNAGSEFKDVLDAIFEQDFEDFEVIIVDSGSTDETLEIAKQFPVSHHTIPPEEFGHGKTRNLALKYCVGEYIVFLSQDALPQDESWLPTLINACEPEKVAGSFSRQIPYDTARAPEVFFYQNYFPDRKRTRALADSEDATIQKTFFSNAASCLKRSLLEKFLFNDKIIMSEDQDWTKKVLEVGYRTVYEPQSKVTHSHSYTFIQIIGRYLDSAYSLNQVFDHHPKRFMTGGIWYILQELFYILSKKPLSIIYFFEYNIAKTIGTLLGLHADKLPKKLIKKLSMHSYYWK